MGGLFLNLLLADVIIDQFQVFWHWVGLGWVGLGWVGLGWVGLLVQSRHWQGMLGLVVVLRWQMAKHQS